VFTAIAFVVLPNTNSAANSTKLSPRAIRLSGSLASMERIDKVKYIQ
jgi:hypothetical protein